MNTTKTDLLTIFYHLQQVSISLNKIETNPVPSEWFYTSEGGRYVNTGQVDCLKNWPLLYCWWRWIGLFRIQHHYLLSKCLLSMCFCHFSHHMSRPPHSGGRTLRHTGNRGITLHQSVWQQLAILKKYTEYDCILGVLELWSKDKHQFTWKRSGLTLEANILTRL